MGKVIKERSFSCNSEYRTIFETPSNTKILDAMYYPSATEDKLTEELLVVRRNKRTLLQRNRIT